MPPNIAMFQFIVCGVTGRAVGKKQKTKKEIRNMSAMMLIAMPQRPREKRAGGSGSRRKHLEKAADGENVGREERGDGERGYGVQGNGGAEIDKCDGDTGTE